MIQRLFSLPSVLAVMVVTGLFVTPNLRGELVGYWNFDDNVLDQSSQGNDGQLINGPKYDADVPSQLGTGKSLFMDGDNFVLIGNPDVLNFGTGDFTISAWAKKDSSVDVRGNIYSNGGDNGGGIRSVLAIGETGGAESATLTLDDNSDKVQTNSGDPSAGFTPINAPNDQWNNIVGVRAGNESRVYVNGVLADTRTLSDGYDLSGQSQLPVYIGVGASASSDPIGEFEKYFNGRVDDVAVWNVALSADDISSLANGASPPSVPEPGSMGLLGIALLGFVARCRRRSR